MRDTERERQTSSDTELLENCRSCLCMLMVKMDFINNICCVVVMQACSMHFSPSSDRWCNKTKGSSKQAKKQTALESTPAGLIPPGMQFEASLFCCGELNHNACCWFPCHFRTWSQSQKAKVVADRSRLLRGINHNRLRKTAGTSHTMPSRNHLWDKKQKPISHSSNVIMMNHKTNKQTNMHAWVEEEFCMNCARYGATAICLGHVLEECQTSIKEVAANLGMFGLKSRKASISRTWGMFGLKSRKALVLQTWACLDWGQGKL